MSKRVPLEGNRQNADNPQRACRSHNRSAFGKQKARDNFGQNNDFNKYAYSASSGPLERADVDVNSGSNVSAYLVGRFKQKPF